MSSATTTPRVSIVVLNYNGARWLERCVASLKTQTIFTQTEIIIADNLSTDGSDKQGEQLVAPLANARFVQHGANLGYCEGNNRAIKEARGEWLFILNNDAWLEPDCLEKLLAAMEAEHATAATPLVMNYDDESFQSLGARGFDLFGLPSTRLQHFDTREVLMPEGCSYLIRRTVFEELGGFDPEFYMYSDEMDLSWRVWLAGHKAIAVPSARLHHRGAANVNPAGGGQVVEFRTSDTKRFYANRNALLVVLKNAQSLLWLMVPLQILLLAAEALVAMVLVRRWSYVKRAYLDALADCWCLRGHLSKERTRLRPFRRRNDIWMLRFLCWRLNRWEEVKRLKQFGVPKVTAK